MFVLKKKILFLIVDGLGDRPSAILNDLTPLEYAETPTLNALAARGICGLHTTIAPGIPPGSDTAHLALFGYNPHKYYTGRGVFEAAGLGIPLQPGDIAFRTNYATIEDGIIVDRRAGRIRDDKDELARLVDGLHIDGIQAIFKHSVEHRGCLVLRGDSLSHQITSNDPKREGNPPPEIAAKEKSAEASAQVLRKLIAKVEERLQDHPLNKQRQALGKLPANTLLVRGASSAVQLPNFEERFALKGAVCVAGFALYKGAAALVGMKVLYVPGATGRVDSDLNAKIKASFEALEENNFVFLHFKGADNEGHDGNFLEKAAYLEKADKALEPVLGRDDLVFALTGDHSTPCGIRDHSADPNPLMAVSSDCLRDSVKEFGERSVIAGGLGHIRGVDVMPIIMGLANRTKKFGA